MNVAYVRVSTAEQNEARQKEALAKYDIEKWFIEKVSGKNTDRKEFQRMMEFVREGDAIYIHDFSRLARSKEGCDIWSSSDAFNSVPQRATASNCSSRYDSISMTTFPFPILYLIRIPL